MILGAQQNIKQAVEGGKRHSEAGTMLPTVQHVRDVVAEQRNAGSCGGCVGECKSDVLGQRNQ